MSIDYSDFTLYGTTVQLFMYNPCTMIDYTPHSLKIVCTRDIPWYKASSTLYIYQGSFKFAFYLTDFRH